MTFGARLRSERKRLKLTQAQVADLGEVVRLSEHMYENDVRLPNLDFLMKLQSAGFDVAYLMFGDDVPAPARGLALTAEQLARVYRAVDEFAIDHLGDPLPVDDRVRLFNFLCESLSGAPGVVDEADLRQRLAHFAKR